MWKCKKCGNTTFNQEVKITTLQTNIKFDKNGSVMNEPEEDERAEEVLYCSRCENSSIFNTIECIAKWIRKVSRVRPKEHTVACCYCTKTLKEEDIIVKNDEEYCPHCRETGYLFDMKMKVRKWKAQKF